MKLARLFDALHRAFHRPGAALHGRVDVVVSALIAVSVVLLGIELWLGLEHPATETLGLVDEVILWIFGVELALRLASYRPPAVEFYVSRSMGRVRLEVVERLRFLARPSILIDLITVLAVVPGLRGLRAVRLLRLLRAGHLLKYSNPFAGLARALEENRLLFAFALSLLGLTTVVGGLSIYLAEAGRNAQIDSIGDGIWWALVTLTTVGYGDISPGTGVGRVVGGLLMVAGMFNLGLFAGLVGHALVHAVLDIREEQFRMTGYIDHIVVCGYDPGAGLLLEALLAETAGTDQAVVLFALGERPRELPPDFTWINGDPTKESELDKVRLDRAAAAVLVGSRAMLPQQADAQTILTAFTIRAYMARPRKGPARSRPLHVVAEVLDGENLGHARTAGVDEVIETTRFGYALVAHAVAQPGTGEILGQVASAWGHSIFVGPSPAPASTFGEMAKALKASHGILLLGVRRGDADVLNPPDEQPIAEGDMLIYLGTRASLRA